jgi:ABC-type enterochelin transport system ATPase subunit
MKEGKIAYEFPKNGALSTAIIQDVFQVEVKIMHTDTGKVVLVF